MMTTFGADPSVLGYSGTQVEQCLRKIDKMGVDQEGEGAEHLYFLLKGLGKTSGGSRTVRPHPEVEKLRFDARVSPVDAIPSDLSDRVYDILGRYARGTVMWDGSAWVDQGPSHTVASAGGHLKKG